VGLPNGNLVVGGAFTDAGGNPAADKAAIWNAGTGKWSSIGGSPSGAFNDTVVAIAVVGPRIILGGAFTNAGGDKRADYLVEWTGSAWKHYGANAAGTDGALTGPVADIAVYGPTTLVAGMFQNAAGIAGADGVAAFNGTKWMALGKTQMVLPMYGLLVVGRTLYASGMAKNIAGIAAADGIAAFGLPAPPSTPRALKPRDGWKRVTLTWKAPSLMNGAPVRDYVVQYRKKGTSAWKTFADGVRTATGAVVTGLTSGVMYQFRVQATNDWGVGAVSLTVNATPR
jgi:hypothetical protein